MDHPASPVLVTRDDLLVADILRLAAAAGVDPELARTPVDALRTWSTASLVLVGADVADELVSLLPPRRPRVHVLSRGPAPDLLFKAALEIGAETVAVFPASETWLVELLTDVGDGGAEPGVTIGVIGGSGGAGATVFAAAMARVGADNEATLLVDADPLGAGVERVLGIESRAGVRWDAMQHATGRLSARSLRETLPRDGRLSVLSWPTERMDTLQPFAMREVISAGRRGFATLVIDLPRQGDAVAQETLSRCDHVLVVSTLTVPGVTAATRVVRRVPSSTQPWLVTRAGGGGVLAEDAATLLGIPLLAAMPDQRGLDEAISLGVGPVRSRRGALARTAQEVRSRLPDRVNAA